MTDERVAARPDGRRRAPWHVHVSFWLLLAVAPATKTWQVITAHGLVANGIRQAAIALAVAAAVGVSVPRRNVVRAVGLWSDEALTDDSHWLSTRWVLALGAAALAVWAATPSLDSWWRWPIIGVGAAALVAVAVLETVRLLRWRKQRWEPRRPQQTTLWVTAPLVVSALATAVALGATKDAGALTGRRLGELALITAFGEELIFRGGLLALGYRVLTPRAAVAAVSVSFGAWHVGDAWVGSLGDTGPQRLAEIAGTIVVTAAAGALLVFVRRRSRSLAGPVLAHIASNLPGIAL